MKPINIPHIQEQKKARKLKWIILLTCAVIFTAHAIGDMNQVDLDATQPSFYDQMVLEGQLPQRTFLEEIAQAQAGIESSKNSFAEEAFQKNVLQAEREDMEALKEMAADMKAVYHESQAPQVTCISEYDRWLDDRVQYAYMLGGLDFVGTIASESMFDPGAIGDGGMAYGFCQLHATWHSDKIREYKALATNEEKLEYCYEVYKGYLDAGNIHKRLYGYNVRHEGLAKLKISCK